MSSLYQEIILDHYRYPHNVGTFGKNENYVSSAKTNVGCGDEIGVQVKLIDSTITEIKWTGVGCVISTAAISMLSDELKGRLKNEVLKMEAKDILEIMGLPEINPGREKCLMLGLRAIKDCLTNIN